MKQISWSEQVVEYSIRRLGVFKNERMLIVNTTMKKMGLQELFIEDKPMGLRLWGCVFSGGGGKAGTQDIECLHLDS